MNNEIVEILKLKELEMDQLIEKAKEEASQYLAEAEQKYKEIHENVFALIPEMTEKINLDEESRLNSLFEQLTDENEEKISKVNEQYILNKKKALEYALNRLLEEIFDQKDDKASDHWSKNHSG